MHFESKVVWITGASSGIGKEMAFQLAAQGAILILTSSKKELLDEIQQELQSSEVYVLPTDLLNIDEIPDLVEKAWLVKGTIDFVILSAGISQRSVAEETSIEVYQKLMGINYFAPVAITQAILSYYKIKNIGNITVISSMAGLIGFPLRSGYVASKHAVKGYFETLQCELLKTNITVSIVYPGRIDTNMSKNALRGNGVRYGFPDANNEIGIRVDKCVKKIIKGIVHKRRAIYVTKFERVLFLFWWFVPSLYYKIAYSRGFSNK